MCIKHSSSHTNLTIYIDTNRQTDAHIHTQRWVIHTWEGVGSQKCLRSDVTYTGALDPNLDLSVFFPWHALPPHLLSFAISFYLFSHKNTFMWLYLHTLLSQVSARRSAASSPVRANKVSSVLFIISNNRAITQVSIWAAALYESHPVLKVRVRERSFNHLRARLPSEWEKEESLRKKKNHMVQAAARYQ